MTDRERKILEKLELIVANHTFSRAHILGHSDCAWGIRTKVDAGRILEISCNVSDTELHIILYEPRFLGAVGQIQVSIPELREEYKHVYSYIGQQAIINGVKLNWTI